MRGTESRVTDTRQTLTVRVPFVIRKRGGRKLILTPDGTEVRIPPRHRIDNPMIKALARGFRWRKLLETGVYGSIEEMAAAEKINSSYVGRIVPLRRVPRAEFFTPPERRERSFACASSRASAHRAFGRDGRRCGRARRPARLGDRRR